MKSSEIKTEQDINQRISELELKKSAHITRQARWRFINSLIKLGILLVILLLGIAYPFIRESITSSINEILRNVVNWYVLLALLAIQIISRLIAYRTR